MRKWGSERHVKQIMEKWSSLSLTSRSLPPSRANDILNVNTAVIWSGLVGSKITSSWLVAAAAVTIGASSLTRARCSISSLPHSNFPSRKLRTRLLPPLSLVTISRPVDVRSTALRRFSAVDAANRASRGWSSGGAVSGQDAVGSESGRTIGRTSVAKGPSFQNRKSSRGRKEGKGRRAACGGGSRKGHKSDA